MIKFVFNILTTVVFIVVAVGLTLSLMGDLPLSRALVAMGAIGALYTAVDMFTSAVNART